MSSWESSDEDEELEAKDTKRGNSSQKVVVKMIDFAHSTYEGFMGDPIPHSGPDAGYVKGLDTLIDFLEAALEKAR